MKKHTKELNVIGVAWHTAHQYELSKIFNRYDLLMNHYRTWGTKSRPMPENMQELLTFDSKDYDLAILHVDQQCTQKDMNKYKLFSEFEELTRGMDRVVINHMTPYDDRLEKDEVISRMKDLVEGIPMITNSRQAADEWGWGNPIIHGMSSSDWVDLPKEPRAITSLSPAGMQTAYRRELLHVMIELLEEDGFPFYWVQSDVKFSTFEDYRDYIGSSLLYINTTWQSPMPRSRTEAMLSGACVISTRHHDWESVIEQGEKEMGGKVGFILPDNPKPFKELIERLLTDGYREAYDIGQRGKKWAQKYFSTTRWQGEWEQFLIQEGVLE